MLYFIIVSLIFNSTNIIMLVTQFCRVSLTDFVLQIRFSKIVL